jgi:hypothetical protein
MLVPLTKNLQQTKVELVGDRGKDIRPQRNPSPPTIAEKEVLGFEGIWIPPGKLEQFRKECCLVSRAGVNAHTNVWLETSDIDTVESEKTDGMNEERNMR